MLDLFLLVVMLAVGFVFPPLLIVIIPGLVAVVVLRAFGALVRLITSCAR
jgi:hypothetical protein